MQAAIDHIVRQHPPFGPLIARVPPPPPPAAAVEPYVALIRAIAHQQLHARAAQAILTRFAGLFPAESFPPPAQILGTHDPALRACGFSASKTAAIRDICRHALTGTVPTAEEAAALDDAALIARLVGIRGMGRWTVEMLLIFTLGRPDVLPVNDFGIRDGWKHLNRLDQPPKPNALAAIGAAWAPYRSTAAWYLWRASEAAKPVRP